VLLAKTLRFGEFVDSVNSSAQLHSSGQPRSKNRFAPNVLHDDEVSIRPSAASLAAASSLPRCTAFVERLPYPRHSFRQRSGITSSRSSGSAHGCRTRNAAPHRSAPITPIVSLPSRLLPFYQLRHSFRL